jgi:hypothetical protein
MTILRQAEFAFRGQHFLCVREGADVSLREFEPCGTYEVLVAQGMGTWDPGSRSVRDLALDDELFEDLAEPGEAESDFLAALEKEATRALCEAGEDVKWLSAAAEKKMRDAPARELALCWEECRVPMDGRPSDELTLVAARLRPQTRKRARASNQTPRRCVARRLNLFRSRRVA